MADRDTRLRIIVDAVNNAGGALGRMGRDLDAVSARTADLRHGMMAVGAAGTAAFAGLAYMTTGFIKAGAGFEQTQIAFETMIGNAELARKTLKDLSQFAARTPFELLQLEEASKRLLAYGVEVDSLIPTLRMLGDISAGVGMDKLPQLILAFGQVRAATKLTGMELRQFSEAGVPLLGTLAQQLGKTEAEVIEMVSAGQIGFPLVQQALASLTGEGGKFFNLMERQSTSLGGLWSNFNDQLALTARSIGEELLPYLKPLMEQLIGVVQVVGNFVKENPKLSAGILVIALAVAGLTALLLPLAIALPGLLIMFGGLATVLAFALGTCTTDDDAPEADVHTHVFTVAQSAQHPSLTLFLDDPNQDYTFALAMLQSLEIDISLGQFAKYMASFRSKVGATATLTPSYSAANHFLPQHGTVKIAAAVTNLSGASEIDVRSVKLTINKNVEDDRKIGSVDQDDILNKQFSVEGSLELVFDDNTFKTDMLADTAKALRIALTNSDVTIGSTSNPSLTIDLSKVKFSSFEKQYSNNDITVATVNFKALYKLSETDMIEATLINTTESY